VRPKAFAGRRQVVAVRRDGSLRLPLRSSGRSWSRPYRDRGHLL